MLHLGHAVTLGLLAFAPSSGANRPRTTLAAAPMAAFGDPQNEVGVDTARIDQAILEGFARGEIELERLDGDCETPACWLDRARQRGHERVLLPVLESIGPDYQIRIEVVDTATGKVLASTEDTCEICGEDEIGVVASDVAAGLLSRLSRLDEQDAELGWLKIVGRPVGATIELDGRAVGTVPWEGEVGVGSHELRLSHTGYTAFNRSFSTSPGEREQLEVDLERLPPVEPKQPPQKALLATGASLVGVGVVGTSTGAGLFALDGRPYRHGCGPEQVDVNGRCPRMYEASAPAVAMVVVGGAAIVAGVAVLVHVLRQRHKGARSTGMALRPSVSGLTLGLPLPALRNRRLGG